MTDSRVAELMAAWSHRIESQGSPEGKGALDRLDKPPSVARIRAQASDVVDLDELFCHLPEFEKQALRREQPSELEVVLTEDQLHVWDPSATDLVVLECRPHWMPRVLGSVEGTPGGARLVVTVGRSRGLRVVVLSARGHLDRDLLVCWAHQSSDPARVSTGSKRVRVCEVVLEPRPAASVLRVGPEPLPAAFEGVQTALSTAAQHGRSGDYSAAASAYTRAHRTASLRGDTTGELKAAAGVAMALGALGYHADAERILHRVATTATVDREWAARLSAQLGWMHLHAGRVEEVSAWVGEARRHGAESPYLALLEGRLAVMEQKWTRALQVLSKLDPSGLAPEAAEVAVLRRARSLAGLGRVQEALEALQGSRSSSASLRALRLETRAAVEASLVGGPRWGAVLADASAFTPSEARAPEVRRPLKDLAAYALLDGRTDVASALLDGLAGEGAFVVMGLAHGSIVRGCSRQARLVSLGTSDLLELAMSARAEMRADNPGVALRSLQTLLELSRDLGGADPVLLVDDGCLRGAPVRAAFELARNAPVLMRSVDVRGRRAAGGQPRSTDILSLADVRGDLPEARRELPAELGGQRLHRSDATWSALTDTASSVGLVHVAVHTRDVNGQLTLELADRLVTATDLLQLRLERAPLCILSGCGTTGVPANRSSFASALLEAGASAVVTTAWPVEDAEMARFVRELTTHWTSEDPVAAVARTRFRMRRQGERARLWAAPEVY